MSRDYLAIKATDLISSAPAALEDNFNSILTSHLSNTAGAPSYVVDGMFFIYNNGGTYEYYIRVNGADVDAFDALLASSSGAKDWNLVSHENFKVETLTSPPGVLTPGRLCFVDTGTNDDGDLYVTDAVANQRVLTSKIETNGANYQRVHPTSTNDSQGVILTLASSSSVNWTILDIPVLLPAQYDDIQATLDSTVLLNVRIKDSGGRATIKFRKEGESTDLGYKVIATVAAETGVYQYGQIICRTNAGKIEYKLDASGASTADVDVSIELCTVHE